jgi:hypothetical protein
MTDNENQRGTVELGDSDGGQVSIGSGLSAKLDIELSQLQLGLEQQQQELIQLARAKIEQVKSDAAEKIKSLQATSNGFEEQIGILNEKNLKLETKFNSDLRSILKTNRILREKVHAFQREKIKQQHDKRINEKNLPVAILSSSTRLLPLKSRTDQINVLKRNRSQSSLTSYTDHVSGQQLLTSASVSPKPIHSYPENASSSTILHFPSTFQKIVSVSTNYNINSHVHAEDPQTPNAVSSRPFPSQSSLMPNFPTHIQYIPVVSIDISHLLPPNGS